MVTYDLWHGYRRLQRRGHTAAWPFGYGLSYSCFALRPGPMQPLPGRGKAPAGVGLTVAVTNAGAMAAAEVVQVYLEPPGRLMERPPRTLVAFQRLELQPGEERQLSLLIPARQLACFDAARDGFVLEAGRHRLVLARHADDPGQAWELELEAVFISS